MHAQAESVGILKQKVRACSKCSLFSQSVSMRDYYINYGVLANLACLRCDAVGTYNNVQVNRIFEFIERKLRSFSWLGKPARRSLSDQTVGSILRPLVIFPNRENDLSSHSMNSKIWPIRTFPYLQHHQWPVL